MTNWGRPAGRPDGTQQNTPAEPSISQVDTGVELMNAVRPPHPQQRLPHLSINSGQAARLLAWCSASQLGPTRQPGFWPNLGPRWSCTAC